VSALWWLTDAPSRLDAALWYTRLGWSVIPSPVGGKRSLVAWKGWQTTQPDEHLWRVWMTKWPRANLAVITGRLSNVVVLDVDVQHGGDQGVAQLEREHGVLPDTALVLTPSGGRHLYFRHPGGRISNSASLLAQGVDVRGDGGLALLPPSRRDQGTYEWFIGPDTLAPMPPWMVAACRPRPGAAHATSSVRTTHLDDARIAVRFEAILRFLNQAPAPTNGQPGGRNAALYWCALRVRDLIREGAPRSLAGDLENAAVDRGLSRAEAKRTIDSGLGAEVRS
jgi:hypothetical protein